MVRPPHQHAASAEEQLTRVVCRLLPPTHPRFSPADALPCFRCGHCKALAPKLELLAQSLEHVETLRIAKFDATANDWMDKGVYAVKGYPTLFFKPAGKSPIPYEGERDPLPLAEYMAAHATHKFVVPASLRTGGGKVKKPKKGKTAPVAGDKAEL